MLKKPLLAGALAATFSIGMAASASASLILDINANGTGSYSTDGGATFVTDDGVLEADPSSAIVGNVLTFALPSDLGFLSGDIAIKDPSGTMILGLIRFTDAAGDGPGYAIYDVRVILYSTATAGNPADTGLPPNASTAYALDADETGFLQYTGGVPNVYNVQLDGIPEPATMTLLGVAGLGLGVVRRNRRRQPAI